MIEDELRTLLAERAGALRDDNPARTAEVRSRIAATRRRRIAGAALGLVLVALAGLAVLRLPGTDESLPPGVPAPPWFDETTVRIPGYSVQEQTGELTEPYVRFAPDQPGEFRYLVAVSCGQRGTLTFRNLGSGRSLTVQCSIPVGERFEGAAAIDAEEADVMLAPGPDSGNVRFEPGAGGQRAALLISNDADRLDPWTDRSSRPLAEGGSTRAGTTVPITVPAAGPEVGQVAMSVGAECVAGVRLELSVPTGRVGTLDCDPTRSTGAPTDMTRGRVQVFLTRSDLARLGLRAGDRAPLTIRSVGRDTDQWRVLPIS